MIDFSKEISLQTTRSGGKGGQNVNKVETAVIGFFTVETSSLLSVEQKIRVLQKLANRINSNGQLVVKAQEHRTQLENKGDAIKKINELIMRALQKKKARIATKPSRAAKAARVDEKKQTGERKRGRQKWKPGSF